MIPPAHRPTSYLNACGSGFRGCPVTLPKLSTRYEPAECAGGPVEPTVSTSIPTTYDPPPKPNRSGAWAVAGGSNLHRTSLLYQLLKLPCLSTTNAPQIIQGQVHDGNDVARRNL